MATITSAKSGDFAATDTWAGGVVPGESDTAVAATGHTVTITTSISVTELKNAGSGTFVCATNGVTITCSGNLTLDPAATAVLLSANAPSGGTIAISCAAVTIGAHTGSAPAAINCGDVGTVTISANSMTGDTSVDGTAPPCVKNASSGTVTITSNVTGGSQNFAYGAQNASTGTLNVTGNVSGGSDGASCGIHNTSTGTVNVTGDVTGGGYVTGFGINNASTGTVNVTGNVTSSSACVGINNASSGHIEITGTIGAGSSVLTAVANTSGGLCRIAGDIYCRGTRTGETTGIKGMFPLSGSWCCKEGSEVAIYAFNDDDWPYSYGATIRTLNRYGSNLPVESDVRDGVLYGADDTIEGTCAVPAPGSVALGVPIDATTGTATLTPQAVWEYATRTLTSAAGGGATPQEIWEYATRTLSGAVQLAASQPNYAPAKAGDQMTLTAAYDKANHVPAKYRG